MYNNILFIDFDGTITSEETLEGTLKRFTPKLLYYWKGAQFKLGILNLSQIVHYGFSKIPSSRLPDILAYVRSVPIRPGFEDLLKTCKEAGIPVVIISGGLRPCIREKLAPYKDYLLDIYDLELDTSGPTMILHSDFEEGDHIMSKVRVMEKFSYKSSMCIGDSFTDFKMAKASDLVFARDRLAKKLAEDGQDFIPWEDFHDVERVIRERFLP